jgi:hypothetical protein
MPIQADTLDVRLEAVRAGVADAASAAGRDPAGITLIVVTKFHPASLVRELFARGVRNVGENRHQDAAPKVQSLGDLDLTWHFIGQLQSKKARAVVAYSRVIHSIDRSSLVDALDRAQTAVDVFLQLNLTDDPARGGARRAELLPLVDRVLACDYLRLRGLMAVAPLGVDPRAAFAEVRRASETVQQQAPDATALSMGMSADYAAAVLEGATHLRIGTAITGNRPQPG